MKIKSLVSLKIWLRLIRTPGFGPVKIRQLLSSLGSIEKFPEASLEMLRTMGISQKLVGAYRRVEEKSIDADLEWLAGEKNYFISCDQACFPPLLNQFSYLPAGLFVKGNKALLLKQQIGMVGSRNPTINGCAIAREFAGQLSRAGVVITSGLALGIDGASHEGVLMEKGETIAVLGTGLKRMYPHRHQKLADKISENGALVSEFPLDEYAKASHFPRRNFTISGLSEGVLVVEAAKKSGSLITAHAACEQGREVFVIPGGIHNPLARGGNYLIREGASLVESAHEILEILGVQSESGVQKNNKRKKEQNKQEQQLLECFKEGPISQDELLVRTQWGQEDLSALLLELEIKGVVVRVPGGILHIK
jgi:DNA processing protein